MLTIRAMSDGAGYSDRHLEHSDYYAEGERVVGQWRGRAAELLGLSGDVHTEQFEAVREGCDPATGAFLRPRQSADRKAADGSAQSHGRNLYDFTFSAPKSVSVMASAVGGDRRLHEAHQKAVAEALTELEAWAGTRVRQAGANEDRTTGNLVLAVYHHDTSRELDPQVHTHAVAANLTWDGTEGRWKALQASDIYQRRAYLTEVYRNALAREVWSLGYDIETRHDAKGRDAGFEITGVSDPILSRYSQRSRQRDEAITSFFQKHGRPPTDNEVAVLVRESRADKLTEISTAEVQERQKARLELGEADTLDNLRKAALDRAGDRTDSVVREPAAPSLEYAKDHVFQRVSVAHDYELLTEALRHGRGRIDLPELRGTMRVGELDGSLLRHGSEIATRDTLRREQEMVSTINRGMGAYTSLGRGEFPVSDRIRPEQKKAVEFVLESRDLAVNIRGAAGAGKTATLEELHRGLNESGREVLAVAPTMSAVEELSRVGFTEAVTAERLLQDTQLQSSLRNKVLIVDEAGMLSGRQMSELLRLAEQQSARLVFSGDTQQIQSVEATDALRVLEKESQLGSVSLTQVQRQQVRAYREAVEELRADPREGFSRLEAMGAVREVRHEERAEAVAESWQQALAQPNSRGQQSSALVICATHDEIGRVTDAIRQRRRTAGQLGDDSSFTRHAPLNWTDAQKRNLRNFQPGQVLEFHRSVKGVRRQESLEVVRVEKGQIVARNAQGDERRFTSKQNQCFSVYEKQTLDIASGDRVLLTANRREQDFRATNGELATVRRIDSQGRMELEDGRVLPAGYRHVEHGYAVTAHRSQGKTVDAVVISAEAMKKELFYVAASRGRESVTVVTSDAELLKDSIARSGARQSAMELARRSQAPKASKSYRTRPGLRQGEPHRGAESARQQARLVARATRRSEEFNQPAEHVVVAKQEQSNKHRSGRGR
jgi:conjugative relaxase-like TrwC/TraI family protein